MMTAATATATDVRQRLVAALVTAGGSDPERRAHAEKELASLELLPGFVSALVVGRRRKGAELELELELQLKLELE